VQFGMNKFGLLVFDAVGNGKEFGFGFTPTDAELYCTHQTKQLMRLGRAAADGGRRR